MEVINYLLILAALVAVVAFTITAITKVSAFYRGQYGFSIWSGVLLLICALVLVVLSDSADVAGNYFCSISACLINLYTLIRDVRLSGLKYGILGYLFQIITTLFLFIILLMDIAIMIGKRIVRGTRRMTTTLGDTTLEIRYAIVLFPIFIRGR